MSLEPPEVQHSERNPNLSKSWIVIWIDRNNLLPISNCLLKLQKDAIHALSQGLVCAPEETLRLLFTIQYLTFNVYYGNGGQSDRKIYSFPQPQSGRYVNCIEQYIEFVESNENELLGWRIHYLIQDTKFSYESALGAYWKTLSEDVGKKSMGPMRSVGKFELDHTKTPPRVFHPCDSREIWIDYALNPYTAERLGDEGIRKSAFNLPLTSTQNSASAIVSLTFTHSVYLISRAHAGRVKPEYLDIANYHGIFPVVQPDAADEALDDEAEEAAPDEEEDEDDNLQFNGDMFNHDVNQNGAGNNVAISNCICFPFGAFHLEHEFRNPEYFFKMNILQKPVDEGIEPEILRRRQRLMLQQSDEVPVHGADMLDAIQACRGRVFNKTPLEIAELRKSREILDMFRAVCYSDDLNPGGLLLNRYCEDQRRRNSNWSIVTTEAPMMDETLTPFGNRVARELYQLELKCGVDVKHSEIFLVQLMTMAAFDIHELKLRIHVLFHGPPAAGKSFILDMHEKLSPVGLLHFIAVQTRKANTTEECFNGLQMVLDELNEMFTAKGDGQGYADVKTLLTKGELLTEMAAVDEHHKRVLLKTVSQRKCQYICNTNVSMSSLPKPVADRFLKIYVPEQYRHDFDPAIEDEHLRSSPESQEELEAYQVIWLHRYMIANFYFTFNRMSTVLMPKIDTSLTADISTTVYDYLRDQCGIKVDMRDRQRILAFSMCCCLFDAIEEVFFSGRIIPAGTPYNDVHLMELIPFLQVTREQFYFAITLFHPTIADPSLPFVLGAIKKIVQGQADDKHKFAHGSSPDTVDYNYYFLPVSAAVSKHEVTAAIASEIVSKVNMEYDQTLNLPTVIDLVHWLTQQSKVALQYDSSGTRTSTTKSIKVAFESQGGVSKPGLEISRDFVDSVLDMDEAIVISAIKASIDKKCVIPRFVTGLTYRHGIPASYGVDKKYIFPFVFLVIETEQCEKKSRLKIRNPHYRRNGAAFLAGTSDRKCPTMKHIKTDACVDDMASLRWRTKHGFVTTHTEPIPGIKCLGDYPMGLISGCLEEYGVVKDLPSTDLRSEYVLNRKKVTLERKFERYTEQLELNPSDSDAQNQLKHVELELELYPTRVEIDQLTRSLEAKLKNEACAVEVEEIKDKIEELQYSEINRYIAGGAIDIAELVSKKRKWLENRILKLSSQPEQLARVTAMKSELATMDVSQPESRKHQRVIMEEEEEDTI